MKKVILAVAALVLTASAVVFTACEKEETSKLAQNATVHSSSKKGETNLQQLRSALVAYYSACDNAYISDSVAFLKACDSDDTISFMKQTGITKNQMMALEHLWQEELAAFLEENPDFKDDESPCYGCISNAMSNLGNVVSATSGHTAALVPLVIVGDDHGRLMMCALRCSVVPPCGQHFCMASCMGWYLWETYIEPIKF